MEAKEFAEIMNSLKEKDKKAWANYHRLTRAMNITIDGEFEDRETRMIAEWIANQLKKD